MVEIKLDDTREKGDTRPLSFEYRMLPPQEGHKIVVWDNLQNKPAVGRIMNLGAAAKEPLPHGVVLSADRTVPGNQVQRAVTLHLPPGAPALSNQVMFNGSPLDRDHLPQELNPRGEKLNPAADVLLQFNRFPPQQKGAVTTQAPAAQAPAAAHPAAAATTTPTTLTGIKADGGLVKGPVKGLATGGPDEVGVVRLHVEPILKDGIRRPAGIESRANPDGTMTIANKADGVELTFSRNVEVRLVDAKGNAYFEVKDGKAQPSIEQQPNAYIGAVKPIASGPQEFELRKRDGTGHLVVWNKTLNAPAEIYKKDEATQKAGDTRADMIIAYGSGTPVDTWNEQNSVVYFPPGSRLDLNIHNEQGAVVETNGAFDRVIQNMRPIGQGLTVIAPAAETGVPGRIPTLAQAPAQPSTTPEPQGAKPTALTAEQGKELLGLIDAAGDDRKPFLNCKNLRALLNETMTPSIEQVQIHLERDMRTLESSWQNNDKFHSTVGKREGFAAPTAPDIRRAAGGPDSYDGSNKPQGGVWKKLEQTVQPWLNEVRDGKKRTGMTTEQDDVTPRMAVSDVPAQSATAAEWPPKPTNPLENFTSQQDARQQVAAALKGFNVKPEEADVAVAGTAQGKQRGAGKDGTAIA